MHRQQAGLVDVQLVDFLRVHRNDRPGQRRYPDLGRPFVALGGAELLGIVDALETLAAAKDDCGGDDRTGQRPDTGLVHAGHPLDAGVPQHALAAAQAF